MPISLSYYVNPTYEIGQICLQSAVFPAFSSVYEVTTGRDQFFFSDLGLGAFHTITHRIHVCYIW